MKKIFFMVFLLIVQGSINSLKAEERTGTNSINTSQTTPSSLSTPQESLKLVSVQIVNATIGPSKIDGSQWSGMGKVNPSITTKVAQILLGANPYTGIVGLLSGSLISGSGKPAPYGVVEVAINGQYFPKFTAKLVKTAKELERTYTPIFYLPAYRNVPFNDGTRFKITLFSKNLMNPKPTPIGVAVINFKDLQRALEEQKIYQVPVADQTENQLLFIGIEVDSVELKNNS